MKIWIVTSGPIVGVGLGEVYIFDNDNDCREFLNLELETTEFSDQTIEEMGDGTVLDVLMAGITVMDDDNTWWEVTTRTI